MKKTIFSILLLSSLLVSCNKEMVISYNQYQATLREDSLLVNKETDSYYQKEKMNQIEVYNSSLNLTNITSTNDIRKITSGRSHTLLNNRDEAKILVIPISFKDSDQTIDKNTKTAYIQSAFFGDESCTFRNSLASFYNKSSYNQLKITGQVAPWIDLNINSYEWKKYDSLYNGAARKIVSEAFKTLVENKYDLSFFDEQIDGIYAIYDDPYSEQISSNEDDNFFWAFCDYFTTSAPSPYTWSGFCWTSFYFIYNQGGLPDASTIIHEVGHLLGLEDYYNTDMKNASNYHPTGFFDMMDSNQGDHNAFSKYLLDWYSPKVIKQGYEGKINLKDFSTSGDSLILPINNNYNDSPFGEYLMLEYFTPKGLNYGDGYRYLYEDNDKNEQIFEFPNHHGLKIYYVDSRLGYFSKTKTVEMDYQLICSIDDPNALTKLQSNTDFFVDFKNSNSVKPNQVADFNDELTSNQRRPLISLLESSGFNSFKDGKYASNDTLFTFGDSFGFDTYINLSKKIGYKFKISNISTDSVTLSFYLNK